MKKSILLSFSYISSSKYENDAPSFSESIELVESMEELVESIFLFSISGFELDLLITILIIKHFSLIGLGEKSLSFFLL